MNIHLKAHKKYKIIVFITFISIIHSFNGIQAQIIPNKQKDKSFGINLSLIGSYGINLCPTITYSLPKHTFLLGPQFMLIPEVGPSNYKQTGGIISYNYFPFKQENKWKIFIGADLQGRKYSNYPGLQNVTSGSTDNFSVASLIFTASPGIQRSLGNKMYLSLQLGAGYLYRWTLDESSKQYNQKELTLFAKTGLGYNFKFKKTKDYQ